MTFGKPPVLERLSFDLPDPPTHNAQITLAKKRTKRTAGGGWMKRALPIVYDNEKKRYGLACLLAIRVNRQPKPPRHPWDFWGLERLHFRVHNAADWLEIGGKAKWTVDFLVDQGYVKDDSPREMAHPEFWPTQSIERQNPGVEITIVRYPSLPDWRDVPASRAPGSSA